MSELRAGIIGTGAMGGRMVDASVKAGAPIIGYDRDAERLAASGLDPASSVADLVSRTDVVLMSLPDSTVIEPVVLGDGGVLANVREGQIVVDLSTASPESTRRIHAALAERRAAYLDAGISGGAKAADAGTLTIMVGGDAEALARVRPTLDHFAARCSTWATAAPVT